MKQVRKKQNQRGFTLLETITVTALIVVLAALVFPAVASLQQRLHMAELDAYARQIFLAAQGELTTMKASGGLSEFTQSLGEGRRLTQAPQDFPESKGTLWKELYALSSDETLAQETLLRANDSLQDATAKGGGFYIELNPISGDVYSVFYAEEGAVDAAQVWALPSRSLDDRKNAQPKLGYYCGSGEDFSAVSLPDAFEPKLEVVNNEELSLTVSCDGLMALRRTQRYLTLSLTIADQHDHQWKKDYQGGRDLFLERDSIQLSMILDSLEEKNRFETVTGGQLTPGDDLTITAVLQYADKGGVVIQGAAQETVNSLFESRTADGDISVSRVRHLNNLRKEIFDRPENITIQQTANIDFDFAHWTRGTDFVSAWTETPMAVFTPITDDIYSKAGATFDGGNWQLTNFNIQGAGWTGLFSALNGWTLQNVRMTDSIVTGTGNMVGALVGTSSNTVFQNCGVYLTTSDASGAFREDMEQRLQTYIVSGKRGVGGLVGSPSGGSMDGCFAAVRVTGTDYIGGLAGYSSNLTVSNSYASEAVTATDGIAGGLIGVFNGGTAQACYETGRVDGKTAGGLVGQASATVTLNDCAVYGRVAAGKTGGPLVGTGSGVTYQGDCRYLEQTSYNDFKDIAGVQAKSYDELLAATENDLVNADPYDSTLRGQTFPFPLATYQGAPVVHHGNWPQASQLQTSLVYYEKYADGKYGYYARTSIVSGQESLGSDWVVNTLRDKGYCVEDGYALLTIYALEKFDYTLETGVADQKPITGTVQVNRTPSNTVNSAKAKQASLIQEKVGLTFKNDAGDVMMIQNARVFRLPFALQITERSASTTFWEKLTITGYYADGTNEAGETNYQAAFQDYPFYFCPDFAKNAVNPDFSKGTISRPKEPSGAERPVYVRSARQLNGLSRAVYYWNEQGGKKERIQFQQELDIDYGKYTKIYCNTRYNLMDTAASNPYRNQPIGRPNIGVGNTTKFIKNFRNSYDGQYHKIIDYRCSASDYQFTGLFGEVQKCILKNIILVASDPENKSGYVESSFLPNGNFRPGVGALVGLVFAHDTDDTDASLAVVENCAVSGYTVSYQGESSKPYAVGGLVGFNFGKIRNCSVVSTTVSLSGGSQNRYLGGFAGSLNGVGSLTNCYAGGTLVFSGKGGVGGLVGGFENIPGQKEGQNGGQRSITNCYSYCTLDSNTLKDAQKDVTAVYGLSTTQDGKITIANSHYLNDTVSVVTKDADLGYSWKQLKEWNIGGDASADRTFPWSAELKGKAYDFRAFVQNAAGQPVHYGDWPDKASSNCDAVYLVYYEQYTDGSWGVYGLDKDGEVANTLDMENKKTIAKTGYGLLLDDKDPDFTLKVQWNNQDLYTQSFLQYFAMGSQLTDSVRPGYILYDLGDKVKTQIQTGNQWNVVTVSLWGGTGHGTCWQQVQVMMPLGAGIRSDMEYIAQIRTPEQLQNSQRADGHQWDFQQTHDIIIPQDSADKYGNISNNSKNSSYNGNGHTITGLVNPLFSQNDGRVEDIHLKDVNIRTASTAAGLVVNGNMETSVLVNCSVEGTIESTGGSAAGLAAHTSGTTIQNCTVNATVKAAGSAGGLIETSTGGALKDSTFTGTVQGGADGAAGLINHLNGGTSVENCTVKADVTATGSAGGLFYSTTSGALTNCTFNGTVNSDSGDAGGFAVTVNAGNGSPITNCSVTANLSAGRDAAGFGISLTGNDPITGCFVNGTVTAAGNASGFVDTNQRPITRCYADAGVLSKTGTASGFVRTLNAQTIKKSYATGTVTAANGVASGFLGVKYNLSGQPIANCATTMTVSGTTAVYGFGPRYSYASSLSDCYHTTETEKPEASESVSGTKKKSVDWSQAVDEQGIPKEDWTDNIQTTD